MDSSVTQSVPNNDVYLGFWTNWSYGRVRGANLTLTNRDGGFLIAFLAVFVVIAGRSFWRVACFMIHGALASNTARDGIYHQRQAVLRNAASGGSGLVGLLQMNWAWRNHTRAQPYWRILPLVTFAIFTLGGFAVAGIFSSRVATSMGDEVLLSGRNCGFQLREDIDANVFITTFLPYTYQRLTSSAHYVQRCYRNNAVNQDCPMFVQKRLPWTGTYDVGCPFPGKDKICRRNSTNLRLDTGYIDSHFDLGINSSPEYRFLFRNVVECAPLNTNGYSKNLTIYPRRNDTSPKQRMQYYYGESRNGGPKWTYQYSADPAAAVRHHDWNFTDVQNDYTVDVSVARWKSDGSISPTSTFLPIAELLAPAADLTLVFLSANDIIFPGPINDDWYAAHSPTTKKVRFFADFPGNHSFYVRDDPVRVLGCMSQYQYCNPTVDSNTSCTPMAGNIQVASFADKLWQTERQKTLFEWSAARFSEYSTSLAIFVSTLGVSSLTSRYSLSGGLQGPLPDDQWQKEVEYWFTATLANLQRVPVEVANGPTDPDMKSILTSPQSPEKNVLCHSQKIRSDAFTSFSTLGLGLLLGIGGLIVVTYWTLEPLAEWISKRTNRGTYQRLEWITNDTLQLQRLAHEELGLGTWSKTATCYPITMPGENLATIDISDPEHPKLQSFINKSEASSDSESSSQRQAASTTQQDVRTTSLDHANPVPESALNLLDSTSPLQDDGQAHLDIPTLPRTRDNDLA